MSNTREAGSPPAHPRRTRRARALLAGIWQSLAVLALCGLWPAAHASGLSVAPTTVEFAASDSVQGLTLHNSGNTLISAQLRVFSWTQQAGQDVLTPSTDLVISPPILRIAPGQRQLVRVVRAHYSPQSAATSPSPREQTYRILIDELPVVAVNPSATTASGLNFVLRFSVPVFIAAGIEPVIPSAARLSLNADATGTYHLHADNPGHRRLQIADLQLLSTQDQILYSENGLLGYVLAGNDRSWPLSLPAATHAAATEIQIRINGEIVRRPLSAMPLEWPAP